MSEHTEKDRNEAVQAVVDRVSSYQGGAPEGTVDSELRKGLAEAGVSLAPEQISKLVDAIDNRPGSVSAAETLAG